MTKMFNISPLVFLLAGCSFASDLPEGEPSMGPPVSAGTVCVTVDQADAEIRVNGELAQGACTEVTQTYTSSVEVQVSKPGFETYTEQVSLATTEPITLKVELQVLEG